MRVGIVGATGMVGGVMRAILAERRFPVDELRCFASPRSAGQVIEWEGRRITIEDAAELVPAQPNVVTLIADRDSRTRSPGGALAASATRLTDGGSSSKPSMPMYRPPPQPASIAASARATTRCFMAACYPDANQAWPLS